MSYLHKQSREARGSDSGDYGVEEVIPTSWCVAEEVSVSESLVWVSGDSLPGGKKRKMNVSEYVVRSMSDAYLTLKCRRSLIDVYLSLRWRLQHTKQKCRRTTS